MTTEQFEKVINQQFDYCKKLLVDKNKEYSFGRDRLHSFKIAATLEGISPKEALAGMMAKHTVSIYDMCKGGSHSIAKWDEKITDHINYLLLLKAMIVEEEKDVEL